MSLLPLPPSLIPFLEPYLPRSNLVLPNRPFVTLTYAQSLDSRIAAKPGAQTKISHQETKTMTHYLRSEHDGIMVGIGTVLADDPKLNCRFVENGNTHSPRPIVLDPYAKWTYHKSQLSEIYNIGQGLAPYILVDESVQLNPLDVATLQQQDGKHIRLPLIKNRQQNWDYILKALVDNGIRSVMIEGGAVIINELLSYGADNYIIDSLIVTIGPVFLGNQGVEVSPTSHVDLEDVKWWTGQQDSVLCATVPKAFKLD
ncbi:5-amino-6-uracil reductase [Scheffersomyces xylosifermentans]|uniref:5-amino-6-uracil reductase n=1 Tax=Scheffersomyces xylosifermentans TaxID=1304137 RepID=UPI00315DA860